MIGRDHRRAAGERLDEHEAVRLGLDRRQREHVEVGHHLGDVVAGLEEHGTRGLGDADAEIRRVAVLIEHRIPHDHQLGTGSRGADLAEGVEQHVEALERIEARDRADDERVVAEVDPATECARERG